LDQAFRETSPADAERRWRRLHSSRSNSPAGVLVVFQRPRKPKLPCRVYCMRILLQRQNLPNYCYLRETSSKILLVFGASSITYAFPLVRAADIAPFIRWMQANGRPVDQALEMAGLPVAPWDTPDRPIAMTSAASVMRSMADAEGPDIACRAVSDASIRDLGTLGLVMPGGGAQYRHSKASQRMVLASG